MRWPSCAKLRVTLAGPETPVSLSQFVAALDNDLNVSTAWGLIFEWVRKTNKDLSAGQVSPGVAASALAAWNKMDSVLGLGAPARS